MNFKVDTNKKNDLDLAYVLAEVWTDLNVVAAILIVKPWIERWWPHWYRQSHASSLIAGRLFYN